ncbi:MAG: hypothetical protein MI700_06920, partial [Balneolales bacterium]|nr:hypothetical protein [Balneolales bacterium]
MSGEWQFFWRELYSPDETIRQMPELEYMPHMWNEDEDLESIGYATYRLKILLPDNHPELALSVPDMYTAYALYVNGKLVSRNGTVGASKNNHAPYWLPETITIGQFEESEIDILLQISNFEHNKGGVRVPIVLGEYSQLKLIRETELSYLFLLAGCLIMGSLFFFGLYFFGKSERAIFYFALFCLIYSYRILGTELYPIHFLLPNLPWWLTAKFEYLSLYLSTLLFGVFIKQLYPEESYVPIFNTFTGIFILFSATVLFLPPFYYTSLINYFFVMMGIYIVYVTYVMIKASMNKQVGSKFTLISVGIIFFVFIYDLLEYFTLVNETLFISFLGYMTFFFFQSLTLSNRFSHSLNEAKEKAETASTAKTHFLSTMGHELRTPLNAVIGLSELLLDSKSEKEKTQFAQTIKKSGENLLGIINNILDFTKIESDEVE